MLLFTDVNDIPLIIQPCGLTIGSFDGVHLGHQALLAHLRSKLPPNGLLAVFTFSNHPSHLFTPHAPVPQICPPLQKAKLLNHYGADIVMLAPFTPEFSATPFDQFLHLLKQKLSFSHLMLGIGATFGARKEGDETRVRSLSSQLNFEVEYLPKFKLHDIPISSGRVRAAISQGAFHEAQTYLGRPYSLLCRLSIEDGRASFHGMGLCLPPEGIYPVRIKTSSGEHLARAQVLPKESKILLELLRKNIPLTQEETEVIFT